MRCHTNHKPSQYFVIEMKSWLRTVRINLTSNLSKSCVNTVLVMMVILAAVDIVNGDNSCNWRGSGLDRDDSARVITPVYLQCRGGQVKWSYPHGALRVVLKLPKRAHAANPREFYACIKLKQRASGNVRAFLEGPRTLHALNAKNDVVRCFNSRKGQAAIYLEASGALSRNDMELLYDLEPLGDKQSFHDKNDDCKPCNREELLEAFCSSDLVTRGQINRVDRNAALERNEITVRITKTIRASKTIANRINSAQIAELLPFDKSTVVHTRAHCYVTHGAGEFVFMARRKLDELMLTCAPRLNEWLALVHEGVESECALKS